MSAVSGTSAGGAPLLAVTGLAKVYPTGKKYPLKFSTEVSVVPDVLPFKMPTAGK